MVLGCVGFVVVVVVAGLVVGPLLLLLLLLSRAINVGRKRENLTRVVVREKKRRRIN